MSESGFPIDPVYDDSKLTDFRPEEKLGKPGEYPFTRGVYPRMYVDRPWTMRQYAGFATAQESNRRYHELIEAGTTGLSVAFDLPTQMGYDSDARVAHGEVGKVGVAIDTVDDMRTLFNGHPPGHRVHVDDDQRARRGAAADVPDGRRGAGRPPGQADRHDPERRAQGVHRPRHLHLPAPPVAAPGRRHVRLLPSRAAQVEHDLHLRLPHGRGRRHPGAGDRVHAGQRQGIRAGGHGVRTGNRRLRPPALLLLRGADHAARGGRQVPRRPAALGRTS